MEDFLHTFSSFHWFKLSWHCCKESLETRSFFIFWFLWQGGFSLLVKSLRIQCIELLTEIEARLDFDDEMPPLDLNLIMHKIHSMAGEVETALETANYDKLLESGLQVVKQSWLMCAFVHVKRYNCWTFADLQRCFWILSNGSAKPSGGTSLAFPILVIGALATS